MGDGVGSNVSGVGRLGIRAHSWDLQNFSLVVLSAKVGKWQFRLMMRVKVDSREVESKWLEGCSLTKAHKGT